MAEVPPLGRLLTMAVAVALEELHRELAARGHESLRPAHGYVLNAVLNGRDTASEIGSSLGMTKQGAAKLVEFLIEEGYLARDPSAPQDGRRKPLVLTDVGRRAISDSVAIQQRIEQDWADLVGPRRMANARAVLEQTVRHATNGELPSVRPPW